MLALIIYVGVAIIGVALGLAYKEKDEDAGYSIIIISCLWPGLLAVLPLVGIGYLFYKLFKQIIK